MTNEEIRYTVKRLLDSRTALVNSVPFFSRLLLKLRVGIADCETAFTDMQNVVFDPNFTKRLGNEELGFVFLHEVLHCVLGHCIRGKSYNQLVYNIACDIVVNSIALEIFGMKRFLVDGSEVMHITPRGTEGREHTAEDVYHMLFGATPEELSDFCKANGIKISGEGEASGEGLFSVLAAAKILDSHGEWSSIENANLLKDRWNNAIKNASKACSRTGSGIPDGIRRYFDDVVTGSKVNWRKVLQDFLRHNRSDFTYNVPDKRFDSDFIMPSFQYNVFGNDARSIWFLVDTSGSVSDGELSEVYGELVGCIRQMDKLEGLLSFFDTAVTQPVGFADEQELLEIKPVGGGGTSFIAIFEYLQKSFDPKELPEAIVILTDGYAAFPKQEAAMNIPVIWIITDKNREAPWGITVHID